MLDEGAKSKGKGCNKKLAVKTIQHASVSRQQPTKIFDPSGSFDQRHCQIPDLPDHRGKKYIAGKNTIANRGVGLMAEYDSHRQYYKIGDGGTPPTNPSTVFPGLTFGLNLCLPMARPTKYAATSVITEVNTIKMT